MRNFALCLVLLVTLPASATISWIQTQKTWNCSPTGSGGVLTCQVISTTNTTTHHLLAVWTFWQSSSAYTVSVADSVTTNNFVSAIGPTVQSVSSTPITAQLFYAKNITGTAIGIDDQVTVTYTGPPSGSISLAGVVMVEYSGLDQTYPLDSVSAGYSYVSGAGTALDSGFAAPANTNLLIFGAGFGDTFGTATTGSGNFVDRADNNAALTGVCGIAEDFIFQPAATALPTFQHANAKCSNGGNWAMQMAIFRDASWTVAGGWSPTRPGAVLYADQFPGSDFGAKVNAAVAAIPSAGGIIDLSGFAGTANWTTPVVLSKPVKLLFGEGTYTCGSAANIQITSSSVEIEGRGYGSFITCDPGNISLITAVGTYAGIHITNIRFANTHTPSMGEGSYENITLNQVTDSTVDHNWSTAGRGLIYCKQCSRVKITDNFASANYDFGIDVGGSGSPGQDSIDIIITGNTIINSQDSGMFGPPHDINMEDTDNSIISNNTILDNGSFGSHMDPTASAIQVFPNHSTTVSHDIVQGNVARSYPIASPVNCISIGGSNAYLQLEISNNECDGYAYGVEGSTFYSSAFTQSSISHNKFNNITQNAIYLTANGTMTVSSGNQLLVSDNLASGTGSAAYRLERMNGLKISGNIADHPGGNGISLLGASYNLVDGNITKDAASTWSGILLTSNNSVTPDHNMLQGNYSFDDQGTPTQAYGINIYTAGVGNFLSGNLLTGNLNGPLNDSGSGTIYNSQAGTGAPTSNCATGSVYLRTDASSPGTVIYVCYSHSWGAIQQP